MAGGADEGTVATDASRRAFKFLFSVLAPLPHSLQLFSGQDLLMVTVSGVGVTAGGTARRAGVVLIHAGIVSCRALSAQRRRPPRDVP